MGDSVETKNGIAKALKEACRTKPFDKISVADITSACGLNRQTFYYHFQDKYELLSWIYKQDLFKEMATGITLKNWDVKLEEMLKIITANKCFYMNTIKEREHTFENDLFQAARHIFINVVGELDVEELPNTVNREFNAEFYAYGICGVISRWIIDGMKIEPDTVAKYLKILSLNSRRAACFKDWG